MKLRFGTAGNPFAELVCSKPIDRGNWYFTCVVSVATALIEVFNCLTQAVMGAAYEVPDTPTNLAT